MKDIELEILRNYGKSNGNKLIKEIKSSPENYLQDDRPIVVEFANIIIQYKLSSLTMKDLYAQNKALKKQLVELQAKLSNTKQIAPTEWPDLLRCKVEGGWGVSVFYIVHYQRPNGLIYYRLPGGEYQFAFDENGSYKHKNRVPKSDCDNKSIQQLKQEGKAFNFMIK